jgi:hypothetical protein
MEKTNFNIQYIYHTTAIREDTKESADWFRHYEKYKDFVMPEIGHVSEDLKNPKYFMLSEYGSMSHKNLSTKFLRYEVIKPLKLIYGKKCKESKEIDGYIQPYGYTYELCLFHPSDCLSSKYTIIEHPQIYQNSEDITRDLEKINLLLKI